MSFDLVMRKRSFLALFLVALSLYSCSPACHQWKLAVIKADCPAARYAKLYLPASNTFNGLDAVLMWSNGRLNFYLNALTFCFPSDDGNETQCEVDFRIDDVMNTFVAERLEGGQSLLLPEEAMQLVVTALLEQQCVEVTVGRFQTTLVPDHFDTSYKKFICPKR
jgi:hypothetical protein